MDKKIEIINKAIDLASEKTNCDNGCKNWCDAFSHRDRACLCSDVFSVPKGQPCAHYSPKK